MQLDPNQIGTDYSSATSVDFIVQSPDASGYATLQVSCDDGNISSVVPVILSNPVQLVNVFPSAMSQNGGSLVRCVLANVGRLPSTLFVNISASIIFLRPVSLEAKTLTVEFIAPSSTGPGLQSVDLTIGNSIFSFSILRTGNVNIVEVIPNEVAAGARVPTRVAVQVLGCNQPELLLNNILLANTAVESSSMSDSSSLFVFSSFVNLSIVGLANVTARFQCGTTAVSMSSVIKVVAASTPNLLTSTVLRDGMNYVILVLSSQSYVIVLETFLIVATGSNQQLPISLQSSTTRCAPSCFFSLSLLIPSGLSSIAFTIQYSATGIIGTQSVSNAVAVQTNSQSRILRVIPSVLDCRGGQVMFVSVASASVQKFTFTSSGFI
jgi:hypothetical protein